MVLGPRLKVINLNILPESSRNELKYSLKIAFMFLSIILKFQVSDMNILLGIRKKVWCSRMGLCLQISLVFACLRLRSGLAMWFVH